MIIEGKEYRTIWFENNVVKIIDQTKLPHQFIIKDLKTVNDAINAIKAMEVRGAPLIGATAAYGLVLAIIENNDQSFLKKSAENLISSRPTAINLKWAVDRMMNKLSGVNSEKILEIALNEAKTICEEDNQLLSLCREDVIKAAETMVNLEVKYIEKMFEMGDIEGISSNDLVHFIKKRANEKLVELGYVDLGDYFAYDKNAAANLDWFYHLTGGVTHTDFFAIRPTDYSKANEGEDFEDIW